MREAVQALKRQLEGEKAPYCCYLSTEETAIAPSFSMMSKKEQPNASPNCYLGKTARATASVYCHVSIKVGRGDEPVLWQMLRAWAVLHSPPYCAYRKNELRTREEMNSKEEVELTQKEQLESSKRKEAQTKEIV